MGKGMLFLVMASSYIVAQLNFSEAESITASEAVRAEYVENILARELAHSAFNLVVSRISQDFSNYRADDSELAYGDGMYAFSASGDAQGPVQITAYGEVGTAVHLIQTTLERTGKPILDSFTIDGPMSTVTAHGSSFMISGMDQPANEEDLAGGNGADGHAIRTILGSTKKAFTDAIDGAQLIGLAGEMDIVNGETEVDLSILENAIRDHEDLQVLEGTQRFTGKNTFGSVEEPVLLMVNGDLTNRGDVTGYGVLVVNGSLSNAGSIRWEGLVLLSSAGGDHEFKGSTDIYGALVMRSLTSDGETGGYEDAGLPNGHFDVDVFDQLGEITYHQHQYDDRFDVSGVDLMSESCELDGGLCWERQVGLSGAVNVRIELENVDETAGTYALQTSSSLFSGPISAGLSQEVELSQLVGFSVNFASACGISGSSPGDVWSDAIAREGQLKIKVYDILPEETGEEADLLHEVVVYRHSSNRSCIGEDHGTVQVDPISFYINGDVQIHLSTSALARLEGLLPVLEAPPMEIKMTTVRQNSARKTVL